tara:strand:- start:5034 stop:5225 length:192 start_codon:yes stop_codon:yes gene_type:complete
MFLCDLNKDQKVKSLKTLTTINGTLYKDTVVRVDEIDSDKDIVRVIDNVGGIWYLKNDEIENI